ncbi:MAG: hypothetical protein ACYCQK_11400, partial [Acidiferrobacteraceae bacterium]
MTAGDLAKARRSGRLQIAAVFALFAIPLVLAIIFYLSGWHPAPVNYGRLITPAQPISPVIVRELDHPGRVPFSKFYGKWLLVAFSAGSCGPACMDALYKMRAMALFQGENSHRVRRVLVFRTPPAAAEVSRLVSQFPGMRIVTGRARRMDRLAAQFSRDGTAARGGVVDIVDPLGNWMMTYPSTA